MFKFFPRKINKLPSAIIFILIISGIYQLAAAGWIQGKAIVAQHLLKHSWEQTIKDNSTVYKPWPWADTWPVAKLLVTELNIEQIILAGDSGSSLAFAPGYSLASAEPNTHGLTMISGHRDTHFNFLKNLKINDSLVLQTTDKTISYKVYDLQIVDSSSYTLPGHSEQGTLVLATCYPFNAVTTGGTLRYLVYAERIQN